MCRVHVPSLRVEYPRPFLHRTNAGGAGQSFHGSIHKPPLLLRVRVVTLKRELDQARAPRNERPDRAATPGRREYQQPRGGNENLKLGTKRALSSVTQVASAEAKSETVAYSDSNLVQMATTQLSLEIIKTAQVVGVAGDSAGQDPPQPTPANGNPMANPRKNTIVEESQKGSSRKPRATSANGETLPKRSRHQHTQRGGGYGTSTIARESAVSQHHDTLSRQKSAATNSRSFVCPGCRGHSSVDNSEGNTHQASKPLSPAQQWSNRTLEGKRWNKLFGCAFAFQGGAG